MRTRLFWLSLGFASASGAIAQFVLKDLWVDRNSLASQVQFPLKRTCIFLTECIQLFVLPFCICVCCWIFSNFWLLLYCSWRKSLIRWKPECRIWNLPFPVNPLHLRYDCFVFRYFLAILILSLLYLFLFSFSTFNNIEVYCQVTEGNKWNQSCGKKSNYYLCLS